MELTEKIETINNQLIDSYGIDTITGQAMWRIAWSEDQFEHRLGTYDDYTPAGLYLRTVTEVRWVPKYRQWIKERHVLERLVLIPDVSMPELPSTKMSYEPMYPFENQNGEYAPPTILACRFIIENVLAAQGKQAFPKYKSKEEGLSKEEYYEMKKQELDQLQTELFGNETDTGDALAYREAIVVPSSYKKEN